MAKKTAKIGKKIISDEEKPNIKKPEEKIGRGIAENLIMLQRVMTNLAIRFDNLADQISRLLNLFEVSAKTLAEKSPGFAGEDNKRIIEKLENLEQQNKILARGLTLLHEKNAGEEQEFFEEPKEMPLPPRPREPPRVFLPVPKPREPARQVQPGTVDLSQYQKSISSQQSSQEPKKFKPLS